ncbi:MAG: hypothetical protein OXK76_12570 [Gammaproteobacteria bacterium]|nr:hypothetical protein [Gammaproteobacteria bacterium]
MQTYIVGIGQCGSSITLDLIAKLTGFSKSKEIRSRPQQHGSKAATNELLTKLMSDYERRNWIGQLADKLKGFVELDKDPGGALLVDPKFAIIDGNDDNYVKNAFAAFQDELTNPVEDLTPLQRYLVDLILDTQVLDLAGRDNGCANGIVGEAVVSNVFPADELRRSLGIDGSGFTVSSHSSGRGPRVRIFFIVASAGGGTGSGGGAHLACDAILDGPESDRGSLVVNLVVLPNTQASVLNPRYALNAGRFLARSCAMVFRRGQPNQRSFSTVLFSNPPNEGDYGQLQALNDYLVEYMMRCANFTFSGNVSIVCRDIDPLELISFMEGKCIVVAMNHLDDRAQDSSDLETELVKPAFGNVFEQDRSGDQRARGLSTERYLTAPEGGGDDRADVLAQSTAAFVALGIPPRLHRTIDVPKVMRLIQEASGSALSSGIYAYSYGSLEDMEITIMFRFRRLEENRLASHFVKRYAGKGRPTKPRGRARPLLEANYIERASKVEDADAEAFEEIAQNRRVTEGFDAFMFDPRSVRKFE